MKLGEIARKLFIREIVGISLIAGEFGSYQADYKPAHKDYFVAQPDGTRVSSNYRKFAEKDSLEKWTYLKSAN